MRPRALAGVLALVSTAFLIKPVDPRELAPTAKR